MTLPPISQIEPGRGEMEEYTGKRSANAPERRQNSEMKNATKSVSFPLLRFHRALRRVDDRFREDDGGKHARVAGF